MRVELRVPKLPDGDEEAALATWHKRVGDRVRQGESIVDIETEKVVLEVPAPSDGVLAEIRFHEGVAVLPGQCIALIENEVWREDGSARVLPAIDEAALASLIERAKAMTGLSRAKQELLETIALIRVVRKRFDAGLASDMGAFHAVFSGNPGTGKTTFARLYAAALKALGVASKDKVVEVTRADLVGGYLGQTAMKTREVIESAIGGCLFIDEAYALVNDDEDWYGREALAELIKAMEDNRSDLVVILAGYTEDMGELLNVNPGLKSRILSTVQFDDYSEDELVTISRSVAADKKYELDTAAEPDLLLHFRNARAEAKSRTFGNAREARNMIELMIRAHAVRVAAIANPTIYQLSRLEACDLAAVVQWRNR
ncbi:AAA family ATPase [Pseudoxanthomonas sp. z9]|uniref:AAA family ATPase n=1 Tax=Pseudoxanthomonas sp. z9 TaxID=2584942 RepID=UPI0015E886A6|nr:AAA family ATPase [Pseudoxanthomonas sp. z9]